MTGIARQAERQAPRRAPTPLECGRLLPHSSPWSQRSAFRITAEATAVSGTGEQKRQQAAALQRGGRPVALALLCALAPFVPRLSAAQVGGTGSPLTLVQTIRLPGVAGRIDHMAVDAAGQRLFVAALGNDSLEVLDVKRGVRLRSVRGLREPQGVAFAPELGRVFVGNGGGASGEILDGKTLERVGSVPDLDDADNVRYDAARREVYVGYGSGALCVIEGRSGRRLREIRLAGHPESFQLEKAGPRLFVNVPEAGQIAVVDRGHVPRAGTLPSARGAVVATWPVQGAGANFPMALDEAHHRLFIGCRRPARLLVYDTETGKPVAAAEIVGDTDDLFYDAARQRIYVSGGAGAITVVAQRDADHYETVARLPTAAGARTSLFVPELDRLFLAVPHRGSQEAEVRVYRVAP